MKNILMVTPLYPLPTPENNCTYVCHFFTREWVKMGYNVLVIHAQPVHCRAWHLLVKMFGKQLFNIMGGGNYYARRIDSTEHYSMDNVPVYRVPIYNTIPHGRYPEKSVKSFVTEVRRIMDGRGFSPDMIVGHGLAMEIIPAINASYGAKTAMVLHGIPRKLDKRYPDYESIIDSYDAWGFRAVSIRERFESRYKKVGKSFVCLSGIPPSHIAESNSRRFDGPLSKFLYVGDLIERKYPICLLEAVPEASKCDYSITFVGQGPERKRLDSVVRSQGLEPHVIFKGSVPRNEVSTYMDEADCLIMVSRAEAYGLVYLEAMARGCIVIASRNEGFDGIIRDGVNGFLCQAGDSGELAEILRRINGLTAEERRAVSNNAWETAKGMTDEAMAKVYISELERL